MHDEPADGDASDVSDTPSVFHATWRWDGVGLEIVIAELPGVQILVPTLADASLAMRKRINRELGVEDGAFEVDLRPASEG